MRLLGSFAIAAAVVSLTACHDEEPAVGSVTAASLFDIDRPFYAWERPERVYVLPVIWIPPESAGIVNQSIYTQTVANLTAHLRVAQEKYRQMLRSPLTGDERGTFELATWIDGNPKWFVDGWNTLQPLVVQSSTTYPSLPPEGMGRDETIAGQVATAAGCQVASCPFVFVIVIADTLGQDDDFAATTFNYGHNGGGGYIRVPLSTVFASNMSGSGFQSSLLHELGHAFGLFHLADIYNPTSSLHLPPPQCRDNWFPPHTGSKPGPDPYDDNGCPASAFPPYCDAMTSAERRLAFHCSPSIMSYAPANWSNGCVATDANGFCAMASPTQIFLNVPGILIAENLYNLARNELVFPELAADYDLLAEDDDGVNDGSVMWHNSFGNPDDPTKTIPGHPRMKASSPFNAYGSEARASFGFYSKSIAPAHAPYDKRTHWHSSEVGVGQWAYVDFDFPGAVSLARVRVFTGYGNGTHAATEVKVEKGNIGGALVHCGTMPLGSRVDGETPVQTTGACLGFKRRYRVSVKAGSSGYVVVRGVRFFDELGRELQGPREPVAESTQGHASYVSDVQTVVGSNQWIKAYSAAWDPTTMWHSKNVGSDWVWIDVRLPDLVNLSKVATLTGHSSQYHPANQIRIEARNAQGNYVLLRDLVPSSASFITTLTTPTKVTHLRIGFKSASGYVVVRGIRFITPSGEVYAPRHDLSSIYPLM